MKLVYIAGPFRGQNAWAIEQNIRVAEDAAYRVAQLGAMPVCPHTNTRYFHGSLPDDFFLKGYLILLSKCDAVFVVGDERWASNVSAGTKAEIDRAHSLKIPVFSAFYALDEWLRSS